jgi:hypothetical protein
LICGSYPRQEKPFRALVQHTTEDEAIQAVNSALAQQKPRTDEKQSGAKEQTRRNIRKGPREIVTDDHHLPADEKDAVERWLSQMPKPEPTSRQPGLDTKSCELDWSGWNRWCDWRIDSKLAEREQFDHAGIAGVVAELQDEIASRDERLKAQAERIEALELKLTKQQAATDALTAEVHQASVEIAKMRITSAELRQALAADRAKVIDLPTPLQRSCSGEGSNNEDRNWH